MGDTHDSLIRTQRAIKAKLTTIEKDLQAQNGAKLSQIRFDETLKKLEQRSKSIESHHAKIYPLCADAAEEANQDAEYNFLYNRHLTLLEELEILRPAPAASVPVVVKTKVKLPELPTPHFDGNLNDWMSFQDLFNCAINSNTSLEPAQKLQYLQNCLSKEAKTVIKHLPATDDNYDEAWRLLKNRFDNKREIITANLRRLTGQPAMKDENGSALRKLIDTTKECFQALKALKQPVQHWDSWLIFIIADKLDAETHRQWVLSIKPATLPTFEELCDFLDQRCRAISESGTVKFKSNSHSNSNEKKVSSHHGSVDAKCRICNDSHLTFKCPTFHKQTIPERRETIKRKNLCFNCLGHGHKTTSCSSSFTCKKCKKKHHTMVHLDSPVPDETPGVSSLTAHKGPQRSQVLLQTAIVNIQDKYGNLQSFRALLDSASEVSFVSERCIKKLALPTKMTNLTIKGVSATVVGSSTKVAQLQVSSRIYVFSTTIAAYVIPRVTGRIPSSDIDPTNLTYLHGLKLADQFYYNPEDIDLLIGADRFSSLQRPTPVIHGPPGSPDAMDTVFGWTISGEVKNSKLAIVTSFHVNCQLETIMQKFWELESVPEVSTNSSEEEECERHFVNNCRRMDNGRYMVRLPLKQDTPALGFSRDLAVRRLMHLERRLKSNPTLRDEYVKVLREYQDLGHMEKVPMNDVRENLSTYYMPHHCVIKESSTTTRVRVVFDASAKTTSGISLNERCMVGPKTQDDLIAILLRFRLWAVAITTDVRKMYSQFLVHPDDRDLQRIVWRENPDNPIEDWRMTGVTFGQTSAPYLATRALKQLAHDEKLNFPLASEVTCRDTCVDDIMTGANDPQEGRILQQQLLQMFPVLVWSFGSGHPMTPAF
ncbi:unnamed protein product [Allacma fusca]|uniref:Peptidase aspartic putative domain-containing protein n=1 Tax=Allacma fusca TaxID=39272 RepID=A0A8J2JHW3_9HEXA|nr:unnamed protein product [Allacma fusca]